MKLALLYYGNPLLRKKAALIEEVNEEIRKLANDMIETMDASRGIGLAATQVGKMLRLFVLRSPSWDEKGELVLLESQVYINAKILKHSKESDVDEEGCLSIPGLRGDVERPLRITVEALDLDGKLFTEHLEGLKARVVMHENDHLNGTLFIDRMEEKSRKRFEPQLREIKKKFNG